MIIRTITLLYFLFFWSERYSKCSEESDIALEKLKKQLLKIESLTNHAPYYKDYSDKALPKAFDFIIIGSGSAGSVIANRLSEVTKWNILLLEAGQEPTGFSDIPLLAPALQFSDFNWGYRMEKEEGVALGMDDQRIPWPRGRGLGGSSIINYMLYVRGNKEDYNKWEKMGNPGWGYKNVFKYFLKSENAMLAINETGYHATGGYQSVQDVPFRTESAHAWIRACQETGYKYVDYNGKQQIGVSYVQGTTINGRRCSVEKAFLRPVRNRPNLTILTGARATQILINPETKEAYGVKYVRKGREYTVSAKKEVISSAGTFHSPQLLMLSGVGPKKQMNQLGVTIIEELPVGRKMYDHLTFMGLLFRVNESITISSEDMTSPESFYSWKRGKGPYTTLAGVEAFTYIKVKDDGEKLLSDIELIFIGLGQQVDRGALFRHVFGFSEETYNAFWKPLEGKPGFMVVPMLLHPKSYGYIDLASRDPFQGPKLYGNYFTDPEGEDMKTFIASIREVQRIITSSPSMHRYNATLVPWSIGGCQDQEWNSDDYWTCGLRHLAANIHHQVSTCKMGAVNDSEAVVDHKLKVYGIKKLRVADCSVIPLPLAAHTNAPAIMVGEKAADLIKADWN